MQKLKINDLIKNLSVIILLLNLSFLVRGQDSPQFIGKQGISIGLVGAPQWPIGVSYDQMLTKNFQYEIGAGVSAAGVSGRYYFSPVHEKFNFFSGFGLMYAYEGEPMVYLPVGVSYFSKNNFQFTLDAGIMFSEYIEPNPSPWFGLKVGRRFGEPIQKIEKEKKTDRKNILSITMGYSDVFIGVAYERLITPYWGTEVSLGLFGASVGTKFYFPRITPKKVNFHVGISQYIGYMGGTYLPIGINKLTEGNYRYSIDVGPYFDELGTDNTPLASFNFRIGKAF